MILTKEEDIKKRWKEYTEELYEKEEKRKAKEKRKDITI